MRGYNRNAERIPTRWQRFKRGRLVRIGRLNFAVRLVFNVHLIAPIVGSIETRDGVSRPQLSHEHGPPSARCGLQCDFVPVVIYAGFAVPEIVTQPVAVDRV